uniref:Acid sphingomyelinase phosphodiesterase 3b n=1 Tax=Ascaris suum TaxID=6253 RepID=F1KXN2_ASCSU
MRIGQLLLLLQSVKLTLSTSVIQFTDFHLDKGYRAFGGDPKRMCHLNGQATKNRTIGDFGNYNCDSPKALVKHILTVASMTLRQPDFIIWTGDTFPHISDYSEKDVENLMYQTTLYLREAFPNIRVFPVFGNHDYSPSDQLPDVDNTLYRVMFKHWVDWIGKEAMKTFRTGGYYVSDMNDKTILLGLNTILYYRNNHYKMSIANDPAGQFAFMRKQLDAARDGNKTAHIIAHIPPGAFEQSPNVTWLKDKFNAELLQILREYSDVIRSMLFGHNHRDSFRLLKGENDSSLAALFIAPAVSPAQFNFPGSTANNPSFRIIDYDEQWHITDIRQYYVSLPELNKDPSTSAEFEYSFRHVYGIESKYISAADINNLIQRLKDDDRLFERYSFYNSVAASSTPFKGQWKDAHLCALEYLDYDAYWSCLNQHHVTQPPPTDGISSSNVFPVLCFPIMYFILHF